MKDARTNSNKIFHNKGPLRVIAIITLWSFIFTNIFGEFLLEKAWAARTPLELARVGSNRAGSSGVYKELNVETFSLPTYLGHINDSWSANNQTIKLSNNPTIIHIQDAHCNYDAQHKIVRIIEHLNKEYGINTINLEGGKGDYDLSIFTNIGDKRIREKVADYFVKEGIVNGSEYFAVNNPEKVTLWGVEDAKLYIENLNAYRESLKYKDEIDIYLKSLSHILTNLKRHIYSQELLDLDKKYTQYKANNLEFKDYLTYLIRKARQKVIDIKPLVNIYLLHQALKEEEDIDFKMANIERNKLVDKLERTLSKNELEELVVKAVEFKEERIPQKEFYAYLIKKAKSINLDLKTFPELHKYIIYVSTYDAVDKTKVMPELAELENKIKEVLYENDKDRELSILSKNLALTKNLFNVTLTRDDYEYYLKNKDLFNTRNFVTFINKEAPLYKITATLGSNITNLDRYREDLAKFYEYSFRRDEAFITNIKWGQVPQQASVVSGWDQSPHESRATVLVTGGFHTENLSALFKKNNISYVSIMPNFKNGDGYESPYFGLLAGKPNSIIEEIHNFLSYALAIASFLNESINIELPEGERRRLEFELLAKWRLEKERSDKKGLAIIHGEHGIGINWEGGTIDLKSIDTAQLENEYEITYVTQFTPSLQLSKTTVVASTPTAPEGPAARVRGTLLSGLGFLIAGGALILLPGFNILGGAILVMGWITFSTGLHAFLIKLFEGAGLRGAWKAEIATKGTDLYTPNWKMQLSSLERGQIWTHEALHFTRLPHPIIFLIQTFLSPLAAILGEILRYKKLTKQPAPQRPQELVSNISANVLKMQELQEQMPLLIEANNAMHKLSTMLRTERPKETLDEGKISNLVNRVIEIMNIVNKIQHESATLWIETRRMLDRWDVQEYLDEETWRLYEKDMKKADSSVTSRWIRLQDMADTVRIRGEYVTERLRAKVVEKRELGLALIDTLKRKIGQIDEITKTHTEQHMSFDEALPILARRIDIMDSLREDYQQLMGCLSCLEDKEREEAEELISVARKLADTATIAPSYLSGFDSFANALFKNSAFSNISNIRIFIKDYNYSSVSILETLSPDNAVRVLSAFRKNLEDTYGVRFKIRELATEDPVIELLIPDVNDEKNWNKYWSNQEEAEKAVEAFMFLASITSLALRNREHFENMQRRDALLITLRAHGDIPFKMSGNRLMVDREELRQRSLLGEKVEVSDGTGEIMTLAEAAYEFNKLQLEISKHEIEKRKEFLTSGDALLPANADEVASLKRALLRINNALEDQRRIRREEVASTLTELEEQGEFPTISTSFWSRIPIIGNFLALTLLYMHEGLHWLADRGRGEIKLIPDEKGNIIGGKYVAKEGTYFKHPVWTALAAPIGSMLITPLIYGLVATVMALTGVDISGILLTSAIITPFAILPAIDGIINLRSKDLYSDLNQVRALRKGKIKGISAVRSSSSVPGRGAFRPERETAVEKFMRDYYTLLYSRFVQGNTGIDVDNAITQFLGEMGISLEKYAKFTSALQIFDYANALYITEVMNREIFIPNGYFVYFSADLSRMQIGEREGAYAIACGRILRQEIVEIPWKGKLIQIPLYLIDEVEKNKQISGISRPDIIVVFNGALKYKMQNFYRFDSQLSNVERRLKIILKRRLKKQIKEGGKLPTLSFEDVIRNVKKRHPWSEGLFRLFHERLRLSGLTDRARASELAQILYRNYVVHEMIHFLIENFMSGSTEDIISTDIAQLVEQGRTLILGDVAEAPEEDIERLVEASETLAENLLNKKGSLWSEFSGLSTPQEKLDAGQKISEATGLLVNLIEDKIYYDSIFHQLSQGTSAAEEEISPDDAHVRAARFVLTYFGQKMQALEEGREYVETAPQQPVDFDRVVAYIFEHPERGKIWARELFAREFNLPTDLMFQIIEGNIMTPRIIDSPPQREGLQPLGGAEVQPPIGGGVERGHLEKLARERSAEELVRYIVETGLYTQITVIREILSQEEYKEKRDKFEYLLVKQVVPVIIKTHLMQITETNLPPFYNETEYKKYWENIFREQNIADLFRYTEHGVSYIRNVILDVFPYLRDANLQGSTLTREDLNGIMVSAINALRYYTEVPIASVPRVWPRPRQRGLVSGEPDLEEYFAGIEEVATGFMAQCRWPERPYAIITSARNFYLKSQQAGVASEFRNRMRKEYHFDNVHLYIVENEDELREAIGKMKRLDGGRRTRAVAFLEMNLLEIAKSETTDIRNEEGEKAFLNIETHYPETGYYSLTGLAIMGMGIMDYWFNRTGEDRSYIIDSLMKVMRAVTLRDWSQTDIEALIQGAIPLFLPRIEKIDLNTWRDKYMARDRALATSL